MQNGTAIKITALKKSYDNGFKALNGINLEISRGEIFALLGPNGAGKTTLINAVCGIVRPSSGTVSIGGYDNILQYRQARSLVGLMPQELSTDLLRTVHASFPAHGSSLFKATLSDPVFRVLQNTH